MPVMKNSLAQYSHQMQLQSKRIPLILLNLIQQVYLD